MRTSIDHCLILELPRISDRRGNLTFVEQQDHVPFELKRVYYLYDVPGGSERGGHAHKEMQSLLIAIAGSFDVRVDDGRRSKTIHLNRPYFGLFIPTMIWRELSNFSSGSVCLSLASTLYSEEDYYRDYHRFVEDVVEP
jgi:dTDP-4-dehydrorhamnose 3,5-epimerase-like enzyme